jgi:hypothetical protein
MVALYTPPLTCETLALVEECRELGRAYEAALEELLAAAGGRAAHRVSGRKSGQARQPWGLRACPVWLTVLTPANHEAEGFTDRLVTYTIH